MEKEGGVELAGARPPAVKVSRLHPQISATKTKGVLFVPYPHCVTMTTNDLNSPGDRTK